MIDLNKRRAKRAATVLTATGYRHGVEWYSAISDVLIDLRHLADAKNLDFEALTCHSEDSYAREIAEDSLPGQRVPPSYSVGSGGEFEEVLVSEERDAGTYSYVARQAKPLREQTLDDFGELFRQCAGLTFVFLAYIPEQVNTASPNVLSAVALARSALQGSSYDPPHADLPAFEVTGSNALPRDQVVQAVQARVMEMQRRKTDYLLIWHVADGKGVRVAGDLCRYRVDLANFLKTEVYDLLRG